MSRNALPDKTKRGTRCRRTTLSRTGGTVAPAIAALLLAATGAFAQAPRDVATASLDQLLEIEVFTASRFPQKVSDAPSAVSVITAADIRAYGYRSLADLLRAVRGLHVTSDRNYSYLGVRGFAPPGDFNARILILIDGYRLNNGTYDETPIGHDLPVDMELIERVEFVRGPGSAVFGGNAFFGVLNVITRQANAGSGSSVTAQLQSPRAGRGFARTSGGSPSGADWQLSASYADSPGVDLQFPEFADPATGTGGIARRRDGERYWNVAGQASWGALSCHEFWSCPDL